MDALQKTPRQLKLQMENDPYYEHGKLLKLNGKIVYDIPKDLVALADELTTLDMSAERESGLMLSVKRLPTIIFSLTNLRCLHLDVNNISFLPNEIGYLSNLERFTCTNNKLQTLPITFMNLKKLQSLHLGSNLFRKIPKQVFGLLNLVFLDFSNNYLTHISEDISNLDKLQTLLLLNNFLRELPKSIGQLQNLKTLWLANNDLTQLPSTFSKLSNLEWSHIQLSSHIDNNPLEKPPLNVCQKGTRAIKKYFDDLSKKKNLSNRYGNNKLTSIHEKTKPHQKFPNDFYSEHNNILKHTVYLPSIKLGKTLKL